MISCPACKSQNIDEARFCGGCGTPLGKPASAPAPSTSLVTCTQGHVYSSVYGACPYCPQSNRPAPQDFATKIEPSPATVIEPLDTVVQPVLNVPSAPATVIEPPSPENTLLNTGNVGAGSASTGQIRRDFSTVIEPIGESRPTVVEPPATIVESRPTVIEPVSEIPVPVPPPTPVVPRPVPPPPPRVTPVNPPSVVPVGSPPPAVPPPPPATSGTGKTERRTVVVPSDGPVSKGRLVGWMVSYSLNEDGVDFRLRATRNVIGAHPSCDIVIDDDAVSGVHASIVWRNGNCYLKDELSSNGTYLNGAEVTEPQQLHNYDEVRIGNMVLVFVAATRPL